MGVRAGVLTGEGQGPYTRRPRAPLGQCVRQTSAAPWCLPPCGPPGTGLDQLQRRSACKVGLLAKIKACKVGLLAKVKV